MNAFRRLRATALGASGALALALLAGRLAGLVREIVLAARFGVSAEADVAIVLLTLPDLLVNLLLSGGLSAVLVPRLRGLSAAEAARLFWETCLWAGLACVGLTILIALWPAAIFGLFAPGVSAPVALAGRDAIAFVALSIPLTALSGVTGALLAARERYFVAGLGTFIFNAAVIAALTLGGGTRGLALLGMAILTGAGVRLASQALILPRNVFRPAGGTSRIDRLFLKAFAAGVAASALALAPPPLIRAAASLLGSGNIAVFNYAQKLVELPLGILITTIGTVSLTRLSGHFAAGERELAREVLWSGLRLAIAIALLVMIFGIGLAEPLVALIFLRGAISADQVAEIAALTRVVLLGVPFVAIGSLATAALNAELRTTEVLRATGWSIIALILLAVPGVTLSSELLLMAAVVGSQAVLAWLLARRAELCFWGADGIANRLFLRAAGLASVVATVFLAVTLLWGRGHAVLLLGLGGVGFTMSMAAFLVTAKD